MNRRTWFGFFAVTVISTVPVNHASGQLRSLLGGGTEIDVISTKDLAALLDKRQAEEDKAKEAGETAKPWKFVLVDVRTQEELDVSVIPGAITKAEYEKNQAKYSGKTVIPYCTIGGRSGAYAKKLAKDGVSVKNYKGSILDWVKNEMPVVTLKGESTNRVHTYSDRYTIPSKYEQVTR
ncbi:MAG: rhodanese-like domain-containing protein [Planctomycetota bacterium]